MTLETISETSCFGGRSGLPVEIRKREGHDHGDYFISTFMQDHLHHRAELLTT